MPVTAKLSKAFYERLGEQIANELVEWFNLVDATYRSDLREINELNYARFEAKLEQRFAQLDAKIDRVEAGLRNSLLIEMTGRFEAQTRLILLSWVTLIAAVVGIGLRR